MTKSRSTAAATTMNKHLSSWVSAALGKFSIFIMLRQDSFICSFVHPRQHTAPILLPSPAYCLCPLRRSVTTQVETCRMNALVAISSDLPFDVPSELTILDFK